MPGGDPTAALTVGGTARGVASIRMKRTSIDSTSIVSVGYDTGAQILEIEFTGGAVYQYADVPEFVHRRLVSASSPGAFVNAMVKPNYRCAEV